MTTTSIRLANVTERISQLALRHPDELAISAGSVSLSFRDLDRQANALAHRIRGGSGEPVGLLMNRSADYIVAALAVMKTGAPYVPIDPATPDARRRFILEDSGARAVIAHQCVAAGFESPCPVVLYESGESEEAPPQVADIDDLAYIIYTSGSTGEPKGVEITHANLATLLDWHQQAFAVTPRDRASQMAGLGFDASVWEIWGNLGAGASIHVTPDDVRTSGVAVRDWLIANGITVAFAPTIIAQQLIALEWPESDTRLRVLLTGADRLQQRPPADLPFLFFNNYGPTECTVVSTSGLVEPTGEVAPSIGMAANGARLHILETGELCVSGPLVGRGYRNRPDLTAERFGEINGEPMYRTGDLVRQLPNGEIEFRGRIDDQIKIRGYRIEPGEISTTLARHPSVVAAAVVARDEVLVAFVVPAKGKGMPAASDLKGFLAPTLPDYMIPETFVEMEALPLTPNGKINVAALPTPSSNSSAAVGIRERISEIVARLLKMPAVDPDANFFLLGGHSLLAAQLLVQVNRTFGVKLALRQMFQAPTVNALTNELSKRKDAK